MLISMVVVSFLVMGQAIRREEEGDDNPCVVEIIGIDGIAVLGLLFLITTLVLVTRIVCMYLYYSLVIILEVR